MYNSKEFEELLKSELYNEADKITPSEDILRRVHTETVKMENLEKPSLRQVILNKTLPFQLNLKRCFSLVLCSVLVLAALTFTFSEDARVAAANGISTLGKWIYVIDRTDNGYTPVKVELDDTSKPDSTVEDASNMTDQEIQKEAGFFVKIPSELRGGYKFNNKAMCIRNDDKSVSLVSAGYSCSNGHISIIIQDKKYLEQFNDRNISKKVNKKVFKIGNREVYWIEQYAKGIYPDHDLQKMPTGVKIIHSLLWEYNGSCYSLVESEHSDISLDNALKIAEAIINDVYLPADTIHKEKETDTYLSVDEPAAEIEKKLGYSAKIPKELPGNFKLILQEISNDTYTNDSKMYKGLYGQVDSGTNVNKVCLFISKSNAYTLEYDRVKEADDDSQSFELDGHKFLWRWNKDIGHYLAWNDNGLYYWIQMSEDDFSSLDEALAMAKAIINYKNK